MFFAIPKMFINISTKFYFKKYWRLRPQSLWYHRQSPLQYSREKTPSPPPSIKNFSSHLMSLCGILLKGFLRGVPSKEMFMKALGMLRVGKGRGWLLKGRAPSEGGIAAPDYFWKPLKALSDPEGPTSMWTTFKERKEMAACGGNSQTLPFEALSKAFTQAFNRL